jgi:hypothetical protein
VVEGTDTPLEERHEFVPAGVAAAGIAVAEAFQYRRGDVYAGRRSQGISLWDPRIHWLQDDAVGPKIEIAPSRWWLIGLGHLGQAFLWTIGMLPYLDAAQVDLMLQDDDVISAANESTGLLTRRGSHGRKARLLAAASDDRGFTTRISERRFAPGQRPRGDEPRLALVGVDNPELRAGLSESGFDVAFEAGLGGGPIHYLDIQTHVFPADRRSEDVSSWQSPRSFDGDLLELPAYSSLIEESGDQCGVIEIASQSVAASFVGATAGAIVVAEAERFVVGERAFTVVDATLRNLDAISAIQSELPTPGINTGFARTA